MMRHPSIMVLGLLEGGLRSCCTSSCRGSCLRVPYGRDPCGRDPSYIVFAMEVM